MLRLKSNSLVVATVVVSLIGAASAVAGEALLVDDTYGGKTLEAKSASKPTLHVEEGVSALLKFDLSTLPDTATAADVQKATLWLYARKSKETASFGVRRVLGVWSEASADITTPNILVGAEPQSVLVPEQGEFIAIDVTALVKAWRSGILLNDGLALVHNSGKLSFHSKESKEGKPPRLQIDLASLGPAGAQGPKGDPGPQGLTGSTGAQGPKGDAGIDGVGQKGDKGDKGETGDEGDKGDKGETGTSGVVTLQQSAGDSVIFSDDPVHWHFVVEPVAVTITNVAQQVHVHSSVGIKSSEISC